MSHLNLFSLIARSEAASVSARLMPAAAFARFRDESRPLCAFFGIPSVWRRGDIAPVLSYTLDLTLREEQSRSS